MKAIIMGAGLAGCALGALLRDRDWEVTLVEKRSQLEKRGYTFTIQRPGWRTLKTLGIDAALRAQGLALPYLRVLDKHGQQIRRIDEVDRILPDAVQLFRWQVNHALRARAAHCEMITGSTITSYEDRGNAVAVQLEGEQTPRVVDLLVGADGIGSQIRAFSGLGKTIGSDTWSANMLGPRREDGFVSRFGHGAYAIIAPTNEKHHHWCLTVRGVSPPDGDARALLTAVEAGLDALGEDPAIAREAEEIHLVQNVEVHAKRWSKGRVVLMGDAAHGMWHSAGLGGSLALRDAESLAAHLSHKPISEALDAYESEQRVLVKAALRIAHQSMRLNLPPGWLGTLRNWAIRRLPLAMLAAPQIEP